MGVNSIRDDKLLAIVPRILNKEALISGRFLSLCCSSLFLFDGNFITFFSVRVLTLKSMETVQVSLKTALHQVKMQFNQI